LKILNVWDDDNSIVCRSPLPTIPELRSKRNRNRSRDVGKKVFLGPDPGFLFSFVPRTAEIKNMADAIAIVLNRRIGHTSYAVHACVIVSISRDSLSSVCTQTIVKIKRTKLYFLLTSSSSSSRGKP
jgi:hypothetical protein